MPQENAEIVRELFDAFQRGDEPAMFARVGPQIVVTQFPDQLDAREYRGHSGVREVMADWIGSWTDWSIELLRAQEVDGCVVATARQRGRGRISGVPMETESAFLFTVDRGVITRWRMFRTEPEAIDAAGRADQ